MTAITNEMRFGGKKFALMTVAALFSAAIALVGGPAWADELAIDQTQVVLDGSAQMEDDPSDLTGSTSDMQAEMVEDTMVGDQTLAGSETASSFVVSDVEGEVENALAAVVSAEPVNPSLSTSQPVSLEAKVSEPAEPAPVVLIEASKEPALKSAASATHQTAASTNSAGANEGAGKVSASAKTSASAKSAAAPSGPADGEYAIRSALASRSVLDVAGGSAASGANVQLYSYNGTKAQQWRVSLDKGSGLYTITNLVSGKVLDVSGASKASGANVQVYKPNGTAAQQWRLVADGSGWRFESALRSGLVLDISGGSSRNGANAQVWSSNKTAAQLFYLVPLSAPVAASTAKVAEGAYVVRSASSGKVLDISGGSRASSANVQQYSANSTYAQRFYFEPDGKGYYRVYGVGSGLALDVSGADIMPGANVQQYSANGTRAQLWSLKANSDGTVTLLSCAGGNALGVSGASKANGANVQTCAPSGSKAQRFKLEATSLISAGGAVALRTALAPSRGIDVSGGSAKSGAALQVYDCNGSAAQRFLVSKASGGAVCLQPVCSRLYVGVSSSGAVVQSASKAAWTLSFSKSGSRRGVVLTLQGEGTAVTAASGARSAALKASAAKGSASQAFLPEVASGVIDGFFIISASDGRVLDIASGSYSRGSNVQVYKRNGSGAQVFSIEPVGTDRCRIVSSKTFQALDVAGGGTADNTNVWQYSANSTAAQLWQVTYDDQGRAIFKNVKSGKLLTMSGSNVCIKTADNSAAQKWTLIPTKRYSVTGDASLDKAVANILADYSSLKSVYNHVAYDYSYREGNKHWSGWSLSDSTSRSYALEMYNYGSGNCYRFASLFAWCARALGYTDVVVRTGWVVGYTAPQAPHGWVTINGYICDPDMQHEASSRNWYWQTWASAPTAYYDW